jgi:hypothetical protein
MPRSLFRFTAWFNLPVTLLVVLLQRTPALRFAISAGETVLKSRPAGLLRAGFALGSLGAAQALAGATQFVQNPANPVAGTVGLPVTVAFTITGSPTPPNSFTIDSPLPPGLRTIPESQGGRVSSGSVVITGVPTQGGTFNVSVTGTDGSYSQTDTLIFVISGGAVATAPAITAQPGPQTVNVGGTATFSVAVSGSPAPTFQWTKNGANITGATASSFVISNVQASDAGSYAVVARNSAGTATSNPATLTVSTVSVGTAPTIVTQPVGVTAAPGGTVALTVVATGSPAPNYQWRRGTTSLAGATDATLLLPAVDAAVAGAYSVVVSNSAGTVTSTSANLAVSAGTARLSNLSVRASLASGATLIVGFATNGNRSVLIRGVGPTLGVFGVPGFMTDPRLELYNSASVQINANDDWAAALAPGFAAVGAFPLAVGSKDAALQAGVAGPHTAQLKGTGAGVVLVEVYDAGSGTAVRLVNVSARNFVGTGDNILIAGFVVDGTVGRTLLIRAVGPTLAAFGVPGTLTDPKLEILSDKAVKLVENDNWSSTLESTATSVGAFPLLTGSRDAALVVTLPPGAYSAQVSGIANGTGEALIEVYEVP